ncbi:MULTISPECIES: PAS domain S-box protein [unclassified Lysobacter]|uniref:PAS domain S-box protein n=1 Tax=unclassified Lysobacter TaxID=2635362 RepID=UPI00138EFD49|nr:MULTISPECIES: PAS domain S-box protein [unclassified Lysobacter]
MRQHSGNQERTQRLLDRLVQNAAADLAVRFQTYEYGLRGARGAVIGAGGSINRERFHRYMESREVAHEFPGTRGFGYIVRVPAGRESSFLAGLRAEGLRDVKVQQLAPHKGEKFLIKYIEPEAGNRVAFGLDIASERNRREAALASLKSGRPTLTGPITLVQAKGKPNRSMLFLLPVYEGTQNRAPAQAEAAGIGWVYAPLVTDEILADFGATHADYGFALTDVTDPARSERIYASDGAADGIDESRSRSQVLPMYGRQWRLDVEAQPATIAALDLPQPLRVAASIAALGALLAVMLYVFLGANERKRRSIAQSARLAAIVESSHDAIIGTSPDGRVTEWNRAAEQMFGYKAEEAIGRSLVELVVPFERIREDGQILQRALAGEEAVAIETIRRHQNGSLLYVEISAAPIRSGSGRVVGVASTLRDIAERKESQAEIMQLNATLEHQVEERTAELQAYSALQRAILANAGYAIIASDPEGRITLFNPAAEAILGYAADEVVGIETPALFHDPIEMAERAHALQMELSRRIDPGFEVFVAKARIEPDSNEWTYITKSGERIPVLLNVSALRKSDGEVVGYLGIAVDLRERKRREAALETNERKLRGLFELSPLGIALTDESGRFVEFNEEFRTLTGYTDQELRTLDQGKITPKEYEQQERAVLRTLQSSGRYGPYEKQFVRRDGGRVPVRLNGVALRIDGRPYTWSIAEDITVQRTAEAAMVDAVAAAEAASKAKSDFLANMSHEIRTPMNAILGMLQLLQKTSLDLRQFDYVNKTETAAKTLLGILNDILDFSKIEAGRQTLESHEFELEQVLRDISVILSANVGDKDIEIVFDIDERVPQRVVGDSLRLQQVLINLVGNAIKFTHYGEVVLMVRVSARDESRVSLAFEVRDSGIGIAEDKLAAIFEGFSQAEASTTRRFGGTGLGLAISQRLVRLMGGELGVESERGRGSRFFFDIALDLPSEPSQAAAGPPERLRELRALVVDDNDSARNAILAMVQSIGWKADAARSGEEALEFVERAAGEGPPYEVIFLDWRMPGLDGWETGRRIRELIGGTQAPLIVMVTAHGREMLVERLGREQTVLDGFLMKPVTVAMLIDAVADARSGQGLPPPLPDPAPLQASRNRLAGMSLLVVEDNPTNQQVVTDLLESEGARVAVAGGGAKALQMLGGQGGKYHVVLMDIQMPDMDGYTATRRIRSNLGLNKLPIIAMTANVLPSDREACLAAGMNDHLGKPFDLDTLVERLLHWTGSAANGAPPTLPPASNDAAASPIRPATGEGARAPVQPASNDDVVAPPVPARSTPAEPATTEPKPAESGPTLSAPAESASTDSASTEFASTESEPATASAQPAPPPPAANEAASLAMLPSAEPPNDERPAPASPKPTKTAKSANGEPPVLDWQAALARFGGKRHVYADVLRGFPDGGTQIMGELATALRSKRREDAMRELHTLRGVAATVGAMRLAQLAELQEKAIAGAGEDWLRTLQLGALRGALNDAAAEVRERLGALDAEQPPPDADAAPLPRPTLQRLRDLLIASNLGALDVFHSLEAGLARHHPGEHRQMAAALAQFDFATAAELCGRLLARSE